MQTTTTQRKATSRTKARTAPVYPDHLAASNHAYFLATLLREQAQLEELAALYCAPGFLRKPDQFQDAIYCAAGRTKHEINKSLKFVVDDGLLPFAHAHTTYFAQQVAA